jgi:SWI/SNF-related matrix-associated actin-dependent regulator 1 of chromatin subfamily A
VATESYLDLSFGTLLERLAAPGAPGGGSAAALTVAFSAGLVAMAARGSEDSWADAGGVAAQALAIRERAAHLALADAEAWEEALAALRDAGPGGDPGRDFALEQKLEHAAALPLEIAELGADAAALAAHASELCEGAYRADAVAAAALAAGGARAAAHIVEVNLAVREGDARLARARASEEAAAAAAGSVLEAGR